MVIVKDGSFNAALNMNLLNCKIYELKGLISSLSLISEVDENMDHPIIENIEKQMNQVINLIEGVN